MKNVLEYLEISASKFPQKMAIIDTNSSITYSEFFNHVGSIGNAVVTKIKQGMPVGLFMEKSIDALCAMLGVAYAGGCYSIFNPELPQDRLLQIDAVLSPGVIITNYDFKKKAEDYFPAKEILTIEELLTYDTTWKPFHNIDTDPLYINFTSGSTGTPKGIVVSHRSVIDFIDCFTRTFSIFEDDVIANQAPFDFDVSVKDIYSALKTGATLILIPKHMFSAPVELVEYLCKHQVTTMIWAVSALCLLSTFHVFDYKVPDKINKIMFSGEVMPYKHLASLMKYFPNAVFVNLYGPTEITCNCTYHTLLKGRDYSNGIPIGIPFENEDVFLLSDNDRRITDMDIIGEICVRGTALALGYFSSHEQTKCAFVQNPLNQAYPELIYRTGDLGKYDENGEIVFSGRKDFQIKYMGHRIELEEIERVISLVDGVERCCCVFDERRSRLKGYYIGEIEKAELFLVLKEKLPVFMIPGTLKKLETMPLTQNGKVDRKALDAMKGGTK